MAASSPYSLCILVALVLVASPAAYGTGINWDVLNTCGRTFGYAMSVTHSALLQNVNPWQWIAGTLMAYLGNNGVSGTVMEPVVHALPRNGSAWSYNYGLCLAKNSSSHYTLCNADDDLHYKPSCQRTGNVFSWGLGILAVAGVVHACFSYKLDEQKKAERAEELTAKKAELAAKKAEQAVKLAYFTCILEKQKMKEEEQAAGVGLLAVQPQIPPAIQQILQQQNQEIRIQMDLQSQEIRVQMEEQNQAIGVRMEEILAQIVRLHQQQPAGAVANHNQIG